MPGPGYSETPLWKKLGVKDSMKIELIEAPKTYSEWLEMDVSKQLVRGKQIPDLIHAFVKQNSAFEKLMKSLKPVIKSNPQIIIWISWYKKSSGINTDITEDTIRNYALKNDLVDVKVCAVSGEWSGLKLVVPVGKR